MPASQTLRMCYFGGLYHHFFSDFSYCVCLFVGSLLFVDFFLFIYVLVHPLLLLLFYYVETLKTANFMTI